jgi:hypothetical protein
MSGALEPLFTHMVIPVIGIDFLKSPLNPMLNFNHLTSPSSELNLLK